MNKVVLAGRNITKNYHQGGLHVDVLKGINIDIVRGERVAIVGSSGSGKTTLLHILGGLDKPTVGEVFIDGEMFSHLSERKRSQIRNRMLGYVYQFHHLLPEFTVLENVCIPLLLRNMSPKEAESRALEILEKVGLQDRQQHKLAELSGGERQRTAIARAIVTKPLCILADEPTGNLDQRTAEKVYETMLELNRDLQTSFLIATHDLELAAKMDRVFRLTDGVLSDA